MGWETVEMEKDRAASLIFLVIGTYGLIFSVQLPFGKLSEPGPGIYPLCLSILLLVSGMLWFIRGKAKRAIKVRIDWHQFIRKLFLPIKIVGITGVFILALGRIGYLLASPLYLFVLFFWVSRYRLWTSVALATTFGVGSWYFFEKVLVTQLPKGLMSF
jgi:putative tricarboxylic transport membrane protein